MSYREFNLKLTKSLISTSRSERNLVRSVALIAGALATVLPVVEYTETKRLLDSIEYSLWGVIVNYTSFWLRSRIAIALIVNLVSIWSLSAKGFLISTLSLLWVSIEYALWLNWSFRVEENLGIGHLPEPSLAGFYGAIWLDIGVLVLIIPLVAWAVKIFVSSFRSSSGERSSKSLSGPLHTG